MKNKIIPKLLLLVVFTISLYSCIHDDISSSDPSFSKEYNSKSVWKEDETYIKNVMKVYQENESKIKKGNGIPLWNYAMTMGRMDESFLIVPVANGKTILSCIQVPRNGDKIRFIYDNDQEHIKFFQSYTTLTQRKPVKQEKLNSVTGKPPGSDCNWTSVSMWYPDNESDPNGSGHWGTSYVLTCLPEQPGGGGGGINDGDPPTYPYPGGSGGNNPQPEDPKNPCDRTKSVLTKSQVQAKIKELKDQAPKGGEIGVKIKSDGTTSATIPGGAHEVDLGDTAGYQGGYHNHTPNGIKMLSPPDIIKLLDFSVAQPNGNIGNGFMGMIGSESCSCPGGIRYYNYMINFSGTSQELSQFLYNNSWDIKTLKKDFMKREAILAGNSVYVDTLGGDLNSNGLQKLFFDTLKNMGMEGKVNLQKIEDNGTVTNITLNSDGTNTTATPCS